MQKIAQAFLDPLPPRVTSILDMRKMFRNISQYLVGLRSPKVKDVIRDLPFPSTRMAYLVP
jgi:hypothetical protein